MLSFNSKKHSTIESLLKDIDYCKWLITNNWFKNKKEYKLVKELLEIKNYPLEIKNYPLEIKNYPLEIKNYPLDTDIIENGLYKGETYYILKKMINDRYTVYFDNYHRRGRGYNFSCSSEYYKKIMKIENYIKFCSKSQSKLGQYCKYLITTEAYKDLIKYSNLEYQQKFKNRFKGKFLEELCKECYKPSRIAYVLSLDLDYDF
jgi:hypothetical protein